MSKRGLLVWSSRLLRWLIAALFLYAGASKLINPARFVTDVYNYHLLNWTPAVAIALYLPWLELISGLALLFSWLYRGAIAILFSLVTIFIVASLSAKLRGINVVCGCFGGASRNLNFVNHIILDLVLLAGITLLWISDQRTRAAIVRGR